MNKDKLTAYVLVIGFFFVIISIIVMIYSSVKGG